MKIPRKLSWVKFDFTNLPKIYHSKYPFRKDEHLIFVGEISNMKGHCIISRKNGKLVIGYHTDNFVELTEDEI